MVEFEIDDRWFEVVAKLPTAVLTRHRKTGSLTVWRLRWDGNDGEFPPGFQAEAFAAFMKAGTKN